MTYSFKKRKIPISKFVFQFLKEFGIVAFTIAILFIIGIVSDYVFFYSEYAKNKTVHYELTNGYGN